MKIIKEEKIIYDGLLKSYDVLIQYKSGKRNITYRFRNDSFLITCPRFTPIRQIKEGLNKYGESLIKRSKVIEPPYTNEYIYILGNKCKLESPILFSDGSLITFKNIDDLLKKLKKLLLNITTKYTREFEKEMCVAKNDIKIINMKTRYGSNRYTLNRISYASLLIHYSYDIIKSVVAHEVAHSLVHDHSKKFYATIIKYYPDYYLYNNKLKKGIYK